MKNDFENQLWFERLISDISARFVKLQPNEVDQEIEGALKQILNFFNGDRCGLLEIQQDKAFAHVTHAYYADGVAQVSTSINLVDLFPWQYEKIIHSGEPLSIVRLADLPPEAQKDRESAMALGFRSSLFIPVFIGERIAYFFSLQTMYEDRDWPEEYILRLRLLAEIFVNALARKEADQTLRESEDRLNLAADSAEAGLWSLNIATGHIWATEKTYELYGVSRENEMKFEAYFNIVHPQDRERIRDATWQGIQSKEDVSDEYRIILSDGSIRWIFSRGRPHLNPYGEVDRLTGVSIDITVRKQMEEQLMDRLREIEKLKEQLEKDNIYLREEVKLRVEQGDIIGESDAIKRVLVQAEQVGPTDTTVLILGETGTGKELLARFIHNQSSRKDRPLVTVNCASLPPTLIESEFFGRERGAYTGALTKMVGRFETADGSTLFLDEIGELPFELQSKFLRVIETGQFQRLGSTKTIQVNVRLIAATNRDLAQDVKEGKFRKDLFYRLNVFPIIIPPLRQRMEDMPYLVWSFVRQFEKSLSKSIDCIPRKTMETLLRYSWPGNIRELKNVIEHAMITSNKTLTVLPTSVMAHEEVDTETLKNMETKHILGVLDKTGWRIAGAKGAAEILGMKRTTLYAKMKALGIRTSKT
jgi:PAS domain S-box-containing protein